ncbi:MAG: efflux RND transporter periplasmic adaptor subunit [Acidobacteria bacterium]|nr:efflux RND transporter periplasmic adaptor subunit [Acidobacteriota bacterium]
MSMDKVIERKKWTPKKIGSLVGALVIVILLLMAIFGVNESSLKVKAERLTISTVAKDRFQEFIPITGTVTPQQTMYMDAVEGGTVEEIFLEAGTMLKKGDKILRLENTNLVLDIIYREAQLFEQSNNLRNSRLLLEQNRLQLNSDLAQAEYELKKKENDFKRKERLWKEQLISEQDYDDARAEYDFLLKKYELTKESLKKELYFGEQQVEQLDKSLKRMRSNLAIVTKNQENLTIKAPISGYLTSLNAEVGQSIAKGERFGQIDQLDGFKVRARVDEHYIARVEMERLGEFDFNGKGYGLIVRKIFPEVKDGTFEIDFDFKDKEPDGIRRGQTLHIKLELGDEEEAIVLPRGGFYQTTGGNWVYVLDESGKKATKRKIKLGTANPSVYQVLEGLKPGEKVITSPYDNFGDMDVLILQD